MNENDALESSLELLGLYSFDRRVYLEIFKRGTRSVSELSRLLGVERPTIYASLERLQQKGLIPQKHKFSRSISVESPQKLIAILEYEKSRFGEQKSLLEQSLPNLLAEYSAKNLPSVYKLFEGKRQFLTIFEESLREAKEEILYYGNAQQFIRYEGEEYEQEYITKRVEKGIFMKILVLESETTKELDFKDKEELRETRFLPKNNYYESSFMVYGAKTLLWNPVAERALVIEDKIITDMFRQMFNNAWEKARQKHQEI